MIMELLSLELQLRTSCSVVHVCVCVLHFTSYQNFSVHFPSSPLSPHYNSPVPSPSFSSTLTSPRRQSLMRSSNLRLPRHPRLAINLRRRLKSHSVLCRRARIRQSHSLLGHSPSEVSSHPKAWGKNSPSRMVLTMIVSGPITSWWWYAWVVQLGQ